MRIATTSILAASLVAAVPVATSPGDDYTWTGDCNSVWWDTCQDGWCDPPLNTIPRIIDNWDGDSCSGTLHPPSIGDLAIILGGDVLVPGDYDAGDLELDASSTLSITGSSGNYELDLWGTDVMNDGEIIINSNSTWYSTLRFNADAMLYGAGEVQMAVPTFGSRLETGSGFTLTHGASHTIHGRGRITADMTNHGTVSGDVTGSALEVRENTITSDGLFEARNGGFLDLYDTTVTQIGSGQFLADGGTIRLFANATISGGTLTGANDGIYSTQVTIGSTLDGVTLDSTAWLGVAGQSGNSRLYLTGTAITNDGVIEINEPEVWYATVIANDSLTLEGTGEIFLDGNGIGAVLTSGVDVTLTNGPDHTIRGRGQVTADLVNQGLVSADHAGGTPLEVRNNSATNIGVMEATNAGALELLETTVTQTGGGEFLADGGTVRLMANATITGGTLRGANGGVYTTQATVGPTLDDLTLDSTAWLGIAGQSGNSRLYLTGTTITNDGVIEVNEPEVWYATVIANDDLTLEGTGEIFLDGNGIGAVLASDVDVTLTNGPDHTIRGRGQITADLVNEGLVSGDDSLGRPLTILGTQVINEGTIEARSGGVLAVQTATIDQTLGGELRADDAGSLPVTHGSTVIGGTLVTTNGGTITSSHQNESVFEDVTLASGTLFHIGGASGTNKVQLRGTTVTNDGSIVVNLPYLWYARILVGSDLTLNGQGDLQLYGAGVSARLEVETGMTLTNGVGHMIHGRGDVYGQLLNYGMIRSDWTGATLRLFPQDGGMENDGTVRVDTGCTLSIEDTSLFAQTGGEIITEGTLVLVGDALDVQGGTLAGDGTVSGHVVNSGGRVGPGLSVGTLSVTGDYVQDLDGMLHVELEGIGNADVLAVGGTAALDGELRIETLGGFVPAIGQEFVIATAGTIDGEFGWVSGLGLYDVTYNDNDVTITVLVSPLPGDANRDGAVDVEDLLAVLGAWGPCPPYDACLPDLNLDGMVAVDDLLQVLANWGS